MTMNQAQAQALKESLGEPEYDEIINCVQENFTPEEVFTDEQLETWAEENGFKKQSE
jgi:hypothetical protein